MIRLILCIFFILSPICLLAQDQKDDLLDTIEYPELLVTPRASKRLHMEAKEEQKNNLMSFAPYFVSALATFAAASSVDGDFEDNPSQANKDNVELANQTGMIVGASWLAVSAAMAFMYRPYKKGFLKIKKKKRKTKREILIRERLAEESLFAPAKMSSRLKWLSFSTNFIASTFIVFIGQKDSRVSGGIAALLSFTPFVFDSHWEGVAKSHKDYKKKIYGPVGVLLKVPGQNKPLAGLGFQYQF